MQTENLDLSIQDSGDFIKELFESLYADVYPTFEEPPAKIKADGHQIFKWVEEGDKIAVQIYKEFIEALAVLVFNTQIIYAPEKIVIGGGLSKVNRIFDDLDVELKKYYDGMGIPSAMQANIVHSHYGQECNLLGAMYNFLQKYQFEDENA